MRSLKSALLFLFLLLGLSGFGQLQFRSPNEMLHYRLDLSTTALEKEDKMGKWESLGRLTFEQIIPQDLPYNAVVMAFNYKKTLLLSILGTQQVYQLDLQKMTLKRLDNSFYRGYNFQAIQYFRNDTLFSHGGTGFWHANNVSTYFSFKAKEWEMTSAPMEMGPRWMKRDFGGYDANRHLLSIIEFPALYETDKRNMTHKYFEKDLQKNDWSYKGELNVDLIKNAGITRLESEYLDGKYFFLNGPILVWADPLSNNIYQANSVIPMFNTYFEFAYQNGYIYSYRRMNAPTNKGIIVKIDSISIEQLKSFSTRKGPFYLKPYPADLMGYGALAILILTTGGIYAYRKSKSKIVQESVAEALDGLPDGASDFIHACLQYPQGHTFSSQHFTELMGYSSYAYETQRQVRAKLIKGINSYFWAHYRLEDVIVRSSANDDKRFSVYQISGIHYAKLKLLLLSSRVD